MHVSTLGKRPHPTPYSMHGLTIDCIKKMDILKEMPPIGFGLYVLKRDELPSRSIWIKGWDAKLSASNCIRLVSKLHP